MAQRRPLWKRILNRAAMLSGTALVGGLSLGLVALGSGAIATRASIDEAGVTAPPVPVSVRALELADAYVIPRRFVGQVEPLRETSLAFEQGGTLAEILVDEGDAVAQGQVLARLDTRSLLARREAQSAARDALAARADLARRTTARREALEARGFTATQAYDEARLALAETEARLREIDAGIAEIDIALDKAVLRAPFAGRVADRALDEGATAAAGQPVIDLLEDAPPSFRVGLSAAAADALVPDQKTNVIIAGQTLPAELTALRPDIDPATRTRTALFSLVAAPDAPPVYGETGTLELTETVTDRGAWVPLGALREGPRGLWTLLVVDPQTDRVATEAVEILFTETERAFVRGTFREGALLIESGPHRVIPGQHVALLKD